MGQNNITVLDFSQPGVKGAGADKISRPPLVHVASDKMADPKMLVKS